MTTTLTAGQRELLADIVGQRELANELGITSSLLAMWIKRYGDFPAPVLTLRAGRFYRRSEVLAWYAGWHEGAEVGDLVTA